MTKSTTQQQQRVPVNGEEASCPEPITNGQPTRVENKGQRHVSPKQNQSRKGQNTREATTARTNVVADNGNTPSTGCTLNDQTPMQPAEWKNKHNKRKQTQQQTGKKRQEHKPAQEIQKGKSKSGPRPVASSVQLVDFYSAVVRPKGFTGCLSGKWLSSGWATRPAGGLVARALFYQPTLERLTPKISKTCGRSTAAYTCGGPSYVFDPLL